MTQAWILSLLRGGVAALHNSGTFGFILSISPSRTFFSSYELITLKYKPRQHSKLILFHTSLLRSFISSSPRRFSPKSRSNSKMADEVALDLEELRHLQSIAKRPRILSLLSSEIRNLEKSSNDASSKATSHTPIPGPAKVPASPATNYATLESFSWDQDNDKVKIYVFLEGVNEEKLESSFKPRSFDIKFHDVQGKNYRYAMPKLNKEIVPEKSKVVVKPNKVIITLVKASKGNWLDLKYKEDKLKPNLDKDRDPMAGIMDLMKNMYEEGDEDMKRTIAKAWTDARSGKTADPMKGYP